MNSALVRPAGDGSSGGMRESASFTAHLKTLERKVPLRGRYENFIGGKWVSPVKGAYFDNISPTTGQVICQIPRSQAEDVELALDAAHAAAGSWGRTPVADRARILNRIADRLEQYLPFLAAVETYDNGKPIRETNLADMPLAVDHFRYFASCVRAQEGSLGELDEDTVAYHYHEPLGVVGQIIPWNFPILMAAWKLKKWLSPFAFPVLSAPILRRTIAARLRTAGLSTASVLQPQFARSKRATSSLALRWRRRT